MELKCVDECALPLRSSEELQETVSKLVELNARFWLEINVRKTEVLSWSGSISSTSAAAIAINDTPLSYIYLF